MEPYNSRKRQPCFSDRDQPGLARRSFNMDELEFVMGLFDAMAQPLQLPPPIFSSRQVERLLAKVCELPDDGFRYRRPINELLQRLVSAGIICEVPVMKDDPTERFFTATWQPSLEEWGLGAACRAYGHPFVSHRYQVNIVRIHRERDGIHSIGSGVVIRPGIILTNRHVLEGAEEVMISFGDQEPVASTEIFLAPEAHDDLGIVLADGIVCNAAFSTRPPLLAEPVTILSYPAVPRLLSRPLLAIPGSIANQGGLRTIDQEIVGAVTAVMVPGSSGGAMFSEEGRLVGIVSTALHGHSLVTETELQLELCHAFVTGDRILEVVPRIHPSLKDWKGRMWDQADD